MDKNNEGQKMTNGQELTKGQEKRLQRKKEIAAAKRKSIMGRVIAIVICIAVLGAAGFAIGYGAYKKANTTVPSSDFSAKYTDEGFIKDVDVEEMVETIDINNIKVPLADVEYTDADVDKAIKTARDAHAVMVTSSAITAQDGDRVNIDYVGTVDGVAFENGDTKGQGADATIGSGTLIDDFEEQLIGHKPGDQFSVNATFPENYSLNPDLASKEAVFEVTMNAVYELPEFNDEFVVQYYSDKASTVEEYRTYLKETNYESNLTTYLQKLITDNSKAISYPSSYLKHVKSLLRYQDEASYEYYNQMSYQYYGSYMYETFEDFTQLTEEAYEDSLQSRAESQTVTDMAYQLIYEKAALSITEAEYNDYITEAGENAVTNYGKPYMMKYLLMEKVINYLKEVAVVE